MASDYGWGFEVIFYCLISKPIWPPAKINETDDRLIAGPLYYHAKNFHMQTLIITIMIVTVYFYVMIVIANFFN